MHKTISQLRSVASALRRKLFHRVELRIMERPLSLADPIAPKGRSTQVPDVNDFPMKKATHEGVDELAPYLDKEKIRTLHQRVDDPNLDFVIRWTDEGTLMGYLMHALGPCYEELWNYTVDPGEGGAYQFDGWVNPAVRGQLVGIAGFIFMFNRRRAEGYKHIRVLIRAHDIRSCRLHERFGFEDIGRLVYRHVGPFKWTRPLSTPQIS